VVAADVPKSIYTSKEWFAAEFRSDDLGGKLNLRNVCVTLSVELYPIQWSDIGDRMLLEASLIYIYIYTYLSCLYIIILLCRWRSAK